MSDFIKKLNVLVRASVNDVLREVTQSSPVGWPSKQVDREVSTLRERINEALDYEDNLVRRVEGLRVDVERLDRETDEAVSQGQDSAARQLAADLNRAQQRLAMAESDLRQHRLVTQELITRVNELEAAVADARRAQADQDAEAQPTTPQDVLERAGQSVTRVLKEMQDKISELSETLDVPPPSDVVDHVDEATIEDDLEKRRNRLSKK